MPASRTVDNLLWISASAIYLKHDPLCTSARSTDGELERWSNTRREVDYVWATTCFCLRTFETCCSLLLLAFRGEAEATRRL